MKDTLTLLHLSDLHFGHGAASHQIDQELVLKELAKDIVSVARREGLVIEVILVNGDVAFSGGARKLAGGSEYDGAAAWFGKLQRDLTHLEVKPVTLSIPGNHDVNRKRGGQGRESLLKSRASAVAVDNVLLDRSFKRLVFSRFEAYSKWAQRFSDSEAADLPGHWEYVWRRDGLAVRFVGFNTCILCHNDDDKGHLQLGRQQLDTLHDDGIDAAFTVALGHHPICGAWLADESYSRALIQRSADIYMHGHLHVQRSIAEASPTTDGFVTIGAGVSHAPESEPQTHSYQIVVLEVEEDGRRSVAIMPRRWVPEAFSYRIDSGTTGREDDRTVRYWLPGIETSARRGKFILADAGAFLNNGLVDQALAVLRAGREVTELAPEERFEWLLIHQKFGRLDGLLNTIDDWLQDGIRDQGLARRVELLRLKVLSQNGVPQEVVSAGEELVSGLELSGQRHLVAQVYHRVGMAYAAIGLPADAAREFERALMVGRDTKNYHQMNTTRFLWAIAAAFAGVSLPSPSMDPREEVIRAGSEYARAPVDPLLWQAARLKSAVHSLFVEGSILLRQPARRRSGLVRLLVGHALVHGTGGRPTSEGYAEHLRLETGPNGELVAAAMTGFQLATRFEREILGNPLVVRASRGILELIQQGMSLKWGDLRRELGEVDRQLL